MKGLKIKIQESLKIIKDAENPCRGRFLRTCLHNNNTKNESCNENRISISFRTEFLISVNNSCERGFMKLFVL